MEIINKLKKIDSIVFGNYILKQYGAMSHLKLQKLVFYCDAYHLACFDQELVEDKFEAWVHGPVSRKLYNCLKDKSILYSDIEYTPTEGINEDEAFNKLTSDQQDLIKAVLTTLSKWTALDLERSTHAEKPWIEARGCLSPASKCNNEISKETTKEFYKNEMATWEA